MPKLPIVITSTNGIHAVQLTDYHGSHRINGTQMEAMLFGIHLQPRSEKTGLGVEFTYGLKLQLDRSTLSEYGLPETRDEALELLAEWAIGEHLDERGLSGLVPERTGHVPRINIPIQRLNPYEPRPKSTDDQVRLYIGSKIYNCDLYRMYASFGRADELRLNVTLDDIRWIARKYDGDYWKCISKTPTYEATRKLIEQFPAGSFPGSGRETKAASPRAFAQPIQDTAEWDAFISHASEDKSGVVEPLAKELTRRGLRIWYDRWVLHIGDSLRRKIDEGLAGSRYGIVVLSPEFFRKQWPQHELDGLVQQEIHGRKVILPIWHNVTRSDVMAYSSTLADKVAGSTGSGIVALADELEAAMQGIT